MIQDDHLILMLALYLAVLIFALYYFLRKKIPTVGIPIAYLFNLSMNHFFGALVYAMPWWHSDDYECTYLGFQLTLYGITAFIFGCTVLGPFYIRSFIPKPNEHAFKVPKNLPSRYLLLGFFFFFICGKFLTKIPSIGTFVQSGWYLLITAVCLFCWKAWIEKKPSKIFWWMVFSLLFPFFTTFNSGFLGLGTVALMSVLFFVCSFFKPRWVVVVSILVSIYLGLSLCVTYFRDRNELRESIWYNQESKGEVFQHIATSLSNFEFLDLRNNSHLERIDGRLNQNQLAGKAVLYIRDGNTSFAHGRTLLGAVLFLVPRIFWPGKPVMGTSDDVTEFTGIAYNDTTTVAMGQVMEFYVNFGVPGVIICFILLGAVMACFDYMAATSLLRGNWQKFTFWFLPGLGFMLSGDAFAAVTGSVAATMIFCFFIHRYMLKDFPLIKLIRRRKMA